MGIRRPQPNHELPNERLLLASVTAPFVVRLIGVDGSSSIDRLITPEDPPTPALEALHTPLGGLPSGVPQRRNQADALLATPEACYDFR